MGTPRVFVCRSFAERQIRDPWAAENMVIHEMLHTLGLGENPPSSREITRRVNDRCQSAAGAVPPPDRGGQTS